MHPQHLHLSSFPNILLLPTRQTPCTRGHITCSPLHDDHCKEMKTREMNTLRAIWVQLMTENLAWSQSRFQRYSHAQKSEAYEQRQRRERGNNERATTAPNKSFEALGSAQRPYQRGIVPSSTGGRGRALQVERRRTHLPKSHLWIGEGLFGLNPPVGSPHLALSTPSHLEGFHGMGNCVSSADPLPFHSAAFANCSANAVSTQCVSTRTKSLENGVRFNAYKSIPSTPKAVEDFRYEAGYDNVHIFTYNELRLATKNFRPDQILGEGGFGVVYKGVIDANIRKGFQDTEVAVKVLNPESFQGDREWLAEVNYLGQFSHPNLVSLIGYCCEDDHRLLVYEYMASGCLERHLFRRVSLTMPWSTRMKIALGAAKGLACLHGAERPVIYRDFKTSNILLDADFNAKLSDFGLAKEGPMGDQTHVSTRVMGTYGYAAPEYVMTGHLTARSDVYGYGVVLLEMLIGRRALDRSRPSQEHNLVEWARPLLVHSKKLLKIVDPRMEGQYATKAILKVAVLAYQCLSPNPKGRPTMNQIVEMLEALQNVPLHTLDSQDCKDGKATTVYNASNCASRPDPKTDHQGMA